MARGQSVPNLGGTGINIILPGLQAIQSDVAANWVPVLENLTISQCLIVAKFAPIALVFTIDLLVSTGGVNTAGFPQFVSTTNGAGFTLPKLQNSIIVAVKDILLQPTISLSAGSLLRFDVLSADNVVSGVYARWS